MGFVELLICEDATCVARRNEVVREALTAVNGRRRLCQRHGQPRANLQAADTLFLFFWRNVCKRGVSSRNMLKNQLKVRKVPIRIFFAKKVGFSFYVRTFHPKGRSHF